MALRAYFSKIHPDAIIPTWGTIDSAACDLYSLEDYVLYPNTVTLVRTGLIAKPPFNFHWEISLRSGFSVKNPGVVLANGIGVIDSDYCGPEDEIKIAILNTNSKVEELPGREYPYYPVKTEQIYYIEKGQRIAQMLLRENVRAEIHEISKEYLQNSSRGGFGSTGSK